MSSQTLIHPVPLSNSVSQATLQDRSDRLSAFVRWALRQSYSSAYSMEQRLQLLDQAWKAQKLLWQLRQQV